MKATETKSSTTARVSNAPFFGSGAFFEPATVLQRKAAFEGDEHSPVQRKAAFESDRIQPRRAAGSFFAPTPTSGRVQARLTVGPADDHYEREADAMADRVTGRSHVPPAHRGDAPGFRVARKATGDETPQVSPDFQSRLQESKGQGQPLDERTRDQMEPAFGADFSTVRIHTGPVAVRMSKEIGAQAFTHGGDIYFNENSYQPGTTSGRHLLAHELTHTVQQGASIQRKAISTSAPPSIQRGVIGDLVNRVLRHVPGWTLLTVIIGKNPATGDAVPRTPANILDGLLGLLPGGGLLANKLRESGALEEAGNWISSELDKLGITFDYIKGLFSRAWDELSIWNGFSENLAIVTRIFSEPYQRIKAFIGRVVDKIKEFVLRGALKLIGAPVEMVMGVLNKAAAAFKLIINDPIGFFRNLVNAVKGGFSRFVGNIRQHLITGLIDWLTGALSTLPIKLPDRFDLRGIIHLVLQILGLTWARIRQALVKRLGERTVAIAEKSVDIVRRLMTEGPMALWDMIREKAAEIKEKILEGIRNWAITQVVKQAVAQIALMLNPAGALVQAVLGIYNLIMFLYENISRIAAFVSSVIDSIAEIASGAIGRAAAYIEQTLARTIPLILNFLARLLRLGDVGKAIAKIIGTIRKPIDKLVDKVVDKLVGFAKKLVQKGKAALGRFVNWLGIKQGFKDKNGEDHSVFYKGKAPRIELMVASVPQPVKELLDKHPEKGSRNWNATQTAFKKLGEAQEEVARLDDEYEATTDQAKRLRLEKQLNQKVTRLQPLVLNLSERLAQLGITGEIDETVITDRKYEGGELTSRALVEPLTALPPKGEPGDPNASKAGNIPGWQHLRNLRLKRPELRAHENYVRLHLVHHNLHGPANQKNLVTASKVANTNFYNKVESSLIPLVYKKGSLMWMQVDVSYHNDFPGFADRLNVSWGKLKRKGKTKSFDRESTQSFSATSIAPPPIKGQVTLKFHGLGREAMVRDLGITPLVARRVAQALKGEPDKSVYQAIDAYYPNAGQFLNRGPFTDYQAGDKSEIRAKVAFLRSKGQEVDIGP